MTTMARLLVVLAWLVWWQVMAVVWVEVPADLSMVVPFAALLSSALVPLVAMGARLWPVSLTVTSSWILAALTWGMGWGSALVASAVVMVMVLSWGDGGRE
ncbi:hypothetical protein SAMN05421874_128133 [Nonomuraea maritima]|uniref:Uncharacterized protein n=2 Tax=Nonomuraea maritima TaxID=683260 RepID=A0A1G9MPU7_9ACTN|nr:hypothetical protein SAMN05421874_128133 [Nonomuraea maritima]